MILHSFLPTPHLEMFLNNLHSFNHPGDYLPFSLDKRDEIDELIVILIGFHPGWVFNLFCHFCLFSVNPLPFWGELVSLKGVSVFVYRFLCLNCLLRVAQSGCWVVLLLS